MSWNNRYRRWAGGVGMAVFAGFAAALFGMAGADAGADEGSAVHTFVDNFLEGIAEPMFDAFDRSVETGSSFLDELLGPLSE
jgi:hypothetical protein